MFTGIIETLGIITSIEKQGDNTIFWIKSGLAAELKIDQSLSHSGVCLTVEEIVGDSHRVTAINETLLKTNLNHWQVNDLINLERCLPFNGRLDGHIVQGHVDDVATCTNVTDKNGSWEYEFTFNEKFANLIIEKGSVCINGISLTCYNLGATNFSVGIIPYTYQHTNIKNVVAGSFVNIEFDVLGKYVERMMGRKV
jgi:riboflavin synthase